MSFMQPPFWADEVRYRRTRSPHATSVLVTPPAIEPITLDQAKLRAGLDWTADTPRDDLMNAFITAARSKVEQDTGLALLTQTRDVYYDTIWDAVLQLPAQSIPLQSVTSVKSTDSSGAIVSTLDPANYTVDLATGRLGLTLSGVWPTDLRPMQPWVIRIVSGWTATNLIPSLLVHAVGLLTAHYATLGRDLASQQQAMVVPQGYDEAIAPYRLIAVA